MTTHQPPTGPRNEFRFRLRPRLNRSEAVFWFCVGAIIGTELLGGATLGCLAFLLPPQRWLSVGVVTLVTLASGLIGGLFGVGVLPKWLKIRRRHTHWHIDVHRLHCLERGRDPLGMNISDSRNRPAH